MKSLECQSVDDSLCNVRLAECMVAKDKLSSQLDVEKTKVLQLKMEVDKAEKNQINLKTLIATLESESVILKTENSQLRSSLSVLSTIGSTSSSGVSRSMNLVSEMDYIPHKTTTSNRNMYDDNTLENNNSNNMYTDNSNSMNVITNTNHSIYNKSTTNSNTIITNENDSKYRNKLYVSDLETKVTSYPDAVNEYDDESLRLMMETLSEVGGTISDKQSYHDPEFLESYPGNSVQYNDNITKSHGDHTGMTNHLSYHNTSYMIYLAHGSCRFYILQLT